ncbi:alcohol dehydrogenase [Cladophialophora yegresii CBS 114405]|uniref:Alcohol dehydrogenase n=1 Tax=Cladophialophora yegresii CBS 114405 TaxID=1182544 RepID=W9WBS0_9EURO|nr:alcohol dehydrogenase [Cladophialophora yegresii CBS 114405]EXJ55984.1 alcohol dehydrogenase [Cladophialophora yegresii CBS 114405]
MPIDLLAEGFGRGFSGIPYGWTVAQGTVVVGVIALLKLYFGGATCRSERVMHGKVVMVTGGTSGIGAAVVQELATRGAQVILLTHHAPSDPFLVDYIEDVRTITNNELIYAEQVDLSSLHSIRLFATKWVDNAPPRRLDMIILCANIMTPYFGTSQTTMDGLEAEWMINYLSTFHLLSILSPAIRAQPPDRDVRILFSTCSSYIGGKLDYKTNEAATKSGTSSYARSKLAVMTFANAFQKHLDAYKRPDNQPSNARVMIIDPGYARTPGTRRWLSGGSIWGLLVYLLSWPLWWLILKSPSQGAQSYLLAAMDAEYGRSPGGKLIKECREYQPLRSDVENEEVAKQLWEFSEKQIERLEKQGAVKRALAKKEAEEEKAANEPTTNSTTAGGKRDPTSGSRRSRKTK